MGENNNNQINGKTHFHLFSSDRHERLFRLEVHAGGEREAESSAIGNGPNDPGTTTTTLTTSATKQQTFACRKKSKLLRIVLLFHRNYFSWQSICYRFGENPLEA